MKNWVAEGIASDVNDFNCRRTRQKYVICCVFKQKQQTLDLVFQSTMKKKTGVEQWITDQSAMFLKTT